MPPKCSRSTLSSAGWPFDVLTYRSNLINQKPGSHRRQSRLAAISSGTTAQPAIHTGKHKVQTSLATPDFIASPSSHCSWAEAQRHQQYKL